MGSEGRRRADQRKFTNCRSASSKSLSIAMTDCRSSRDLEDTRSSSPWIWALTDLGPSSRISLATFLAFSVVMPSVVVAVIL